MPAKTVLIMVGRWASRISGIPSPHNCIFMFITREHAHKAPSTYRQEMFCRQKDEARIDIQ